MTVPTISPKVLDKATRRALGVSVPRGTLSALRLTTGPNRTLTMDFARI
jgi:hypothetical protein